MPASESPETQLVNPEPELELLSTPRVKDVRLIVPCGDLMDGLRDLLLGSGPVAIDAERASGFKYSQRAYLVQMYRIGGPILLIDPIAIVLEDAQAFAAVQKELEHLEWIIHAATQDIPCLAEIGLRPKYLFDTELAGRLAGFERVGLGAMVARCLGLKLAKEHSAVDWSTRPLISSWLSYAALDVDILPQLREELSKELEAQGKLNWAGQDFQALTNFASKPPKLDKWRGLSGLSSVKDQRQLAIARALWMAREKLAQKLDVSPTRLLPDASIVEAAGSKARTRAQLAANRKFAGRASRSYLDLWWEAYEQGLATTDLPPMRAAATGIPNHRSWPSKYPEADARLSEARKLLCVLSEEHGIPAENLLSPDWVRTLCWENEEPKPELIAERLLALGARRWQVELTSGALALTLAAAQP